MNTNKENTMITEADILRAAKHQSSALNFMFDSIFKTNPMAELPKPVAPDSTTTEEK